MIQAINAKGHKQNFSDLAWKMLGNNKNGWRINEEQPVSNSVKSTKLPTGQKEVQSIGNSAKGDEQKVGNTTAPTEPVIETKQPPLNTVKAEFMEQISGLSRDVMKNFLDEKNVSYNKRAGAEELAALVGEALDYDLAEFEKAFA